MMGEKTYFEDMDIEYCDGIITCSYRGEALVTFDVTRVGNPVGEHDQNEDDEGHYIYEEEEKERDNTEYKVGDTLLLDLDSDSPEECVEGINTLGTVVLLPKESSDCYLVTPTLEGTWTGWNPPGLPGNVWYVSPDQILSKVGTS